MGQTSGRDYGLAVVGCGVISDTHLAAIQSLPNAHLVAVLDTREEAARAKAEEYGVEAYTDFQKLLTRPDVDVVDIVVPSGLHAQLGIQAAQAGKHVVTTKPLDVTLEAIDALIAACDENQVKLGVVLQLRTYPFFRRIQTAVREGQLGRLYYGAAIVPWFRSHEYYARGWQGTRALDGGGALMNQSIHYIDLLLAIMGQVSEVCGFADNLAHDIEVEDIATAAVKFTSGAHGLIQGNTLTYQGLPARLEIHGSQGNIIVAGEDLQLWEVEGEETYFDPEAGRHKGGAADPKSGMLGYAVQAHAEQIADVLAAIEEGRSPKLDGHEARRAVELILAIYQSSAERRFLSLG
ncbi:MAG: Gfo/Idh/MocA family oxidoreductase [candidate division WS1 bacterium]|nr:Gfo/Idh/MocA family oxidoreductase [candidate division WS1 bacterium]